MMRILFTTVLFLNIPIAVASLFFAFILLRRAKGNPIYFNFGMANLSLGLWATDVFLLFMVSSLGILLGNLSYLFGIWILHYFLLFTYVFPFSIPNLRPKFIILYLLTLLVSISIFIPGLYATSASLDFPYLYFKANPVGITIFSFYFALLSILSFKNLILKYLKSDGIFRTHLRKIMFGTGIALVFNFIFSINIYYFTEFDTTPLGVLFAFFVLVYIYSILFSKTDR